MLLWNLLAEAAEGGAGNGGDVADKPDIGGLIMVGVMLVAIIALFVWQSISNKKKQKEAQEMVNQLKIGDRVKTIGGICGFVAQINDGENTFVLETGLEENKSYIKFDKGAIYQTAPAQGNAVEKAEPVKEEKKEVVEEVKEETVAEEKPKKTRNKKAEEVKEETAE